VCGWWLPTNELSQYPPLSSSSSLPNHPTPPPAKEDGKTIVLVVLLQAMAYGRLSDGARVLVGGAVRLRGDRCLDVAWRIFLVVGASTTQRRGPGGSSTRGRAFSVQPRS